MRTPHWDYESGNADRIINRGRALLGSVLVSSDGADGEIDVYDGVSAADPLICKILAPDTYSFQARFGEGVLCQRGIYIDVNADTTYFTVEYVPIEPLGLKGG